MTLRPGPAHLALLAALAVPGPALAQADMDRTSVGFRLWCGAVFVQAANIVAPFTDPETYRRHGQALRGEALDMLAASGVAESQRDQQAFLQSLAVQSRFRDPESRAETVTACVESFPVAARQAEASPLQDPVPAPGPASLPVPGPIPATSATALAPELLGAYRDVLMRGLPTGLDSLEPAAERGDPVAAFVVGNFYTYGSQDMRADTDTAMYWLRKAAERGNAMGQYALGRLLANAGDDVQAAAWYRLAAESGHENAREVLARAHVLGQGVPYDRDASLHWYGLAAQQGSIEAARSLGLWGRPVPQFPATMEQARAALQAGDPTPLTLLAEAGHIDAQSDLGWRHSVGEGVPKDLAKAVRLLRSAAEQGSTGALSRLAVVEAELAGLH